MRILIVAAHPDDEVLGMGGTMARLVQDGHELSVVFLSDGVTARYLNPDEPQARAEVYARRESARDANAVFKVTDIAFHGFPDNKFDSVPLLEITRTVSREITRIGPQVIYTHHVHDLNIDHQRTAQAVLTATRPMHGQIVREVYAFETPSSTEWTFASTFHPTFFSDIGGTITQKLEALKCYDTECRVFPHPRSPEAVKTNARRWGSVVGCEYAEAFECVRVIR